ncbi:MAG: hypothetical protein EZS28_024064 [Streblomastix strix]|uniref:Uncharacterized protein n=1 Tax=Streblomastix strix TaxID=222440 RepID=A0A5J4VD36_9EUKA|nr:MAG: hypothetical protein EZS28_024064 [Streblomastix strix]
MGEVMIVQPRPDYPTDVQSPSQKQTDQLSSQATSSSSLYPYSSKTSSSQSSSSSIVTPTPSPIQFQQLIHRSPMQLPLHVNFSCGRPLTWHPEEMVLPLSGRMRKYFFSSQYRNLFYEHLEKMRPKRSSGDGSSETYVQRFFIDWSRIKWMMSGKHTEQL